MVHHDTSIQRRKAKAKAANEANRKKAQEEAKARKLAKICKEHPECCAI